MKKCYPMYLVVSIEADSEEDAVHRMTTWLQELPAPYSGIRLGFQGMAFSTSPMDESDAYAINARNSPWYREYDEASIHN